MNKHNLDWNYDSLAASYDKRADYAQKAIDRLTEKVGLDSHRQVADIGAGTGKLTKELLKRRYQVVAVEPNDEMRKFGIKNTENQNVTWINGTGENTTLEDNSVYAAFFGSSFNVLDRLKALNEVSRICLPNSWFACMWNHRDLEDPDQKAIEDIIKNEIDEYNYGTRREDQSEFLTASGMLSQLQTIEETEVHEIPVADYIQAWRSHATLQRQAGDKFNEVIDKIEQYLANQSIIAVPYTTRIWCGQLAN